MRRHAKAIVAISAMLLTLALGVTIASAVAPSVTIEAASEVSYVSAKAKGTVDPGDHEASYHFEVATEADFSNVSGFAGFGSLPESAGSTPVEGTFGELKPGTTYHLRLVAENLDGRSEAVAASTFTTAAVAAPTVLIDPVASITGNSAHFEGQINPNAPEAAPASPQVEAAFKVSWRFQCTPSCPSVEASQSMPADNSSHTVEADAANLDHNTDYEVKLIAENAAGPQQAGPQSFKTLAVGPEAISQSAAGITETTAVVGGWVDPNGSPTTYFVQYATAADFSGAVSVPASENASAGSGQAPVAVFRRVEGLSPDVHYFYRLKAHSSAGDSTSAPSDFRTLAPLPPAGPCPNEQFRVGASAGLSECRAYEKVSPGFKNGGDAIVGAILDGDHVAVPGTSAFLPGDPFYKDIARYLGSRTSSGWVLRPGYAAATTNVADVNTDDTQDVLEQSGFCSPCPRLTSDDTDAGNDLYTRTVEGFQLVSKGSIGGNSGDPAFYAGQSADGKHIFFETAEQLEPADSGRAPETLQLYERVGNQTRVVGLDSAGALLNSGGAVLGNGTRDNGTPAGSTNAISADGSTVFFESPDPALSDSQQVYVRKAGTQTAQVSASKCSPACGPEEPATFQGASDDGSIAYFTTAGQLVPEDSDDIVDLYQYQVASGQLTLVTQDCAASDGSQVNCGFPGGLAFNDSTLEGIIGVSANGHRIYFTASPAPEGHFGDDENTPLLSSVWLYDQDAGGTRFVAPAGGVSGGAVVSRGLATPQTAAGMTPDGGTLIFQSDLKLTSFDNSSMRSCSRTENTGTVTFSPCLELYSYQVQTDRIACISCNPDGTPPIGPTDEDDTLMSTGTSLSTIAGSEHPNQLITDDGRLIVFQTQDALVPQDTNGKIDVYQWRDGDVSLLTTGRSEADARIAGVTPDGHDIFFTTYDRLTPSDNDFQADFYDARIGGGLDADYPAPVAPPCSGEACRQPSNPSPAAVIPTTAGFQGPSNPHAVRKHKRKHKRHKRGHAKHRATKHAKKGKASR